MLISIRDFAVNYDNRQIAVINGDNKVRIWSTDNFELLHEIDVEASRVDLFPCGEKLLTVDFDDIAVVWDLKKGKQIVKANIAKMTKSDYLFFRKIAVSRKSGNILFYTGLFIAIFDEKIKKKLVYYNNEPDSQSYKYHEKSERMAYLAYGLDDKKKLLVFDVGSGSLILEKEINDGYVSDFCFSKDGEKLFYNISKPLFEEDEEGNIFNTGTTNRINTINLCDSTIETGFEYERVRNESIEKIIAHEEDKSIAVLTNLRLLSVSNNSEKVVEILKIPKGIEYHNMGYYEPSNSLVLFYGEPCTEKSNLQNSAYDSKVLLISDYDHEIKELPYGDFKTASGDCDGAMSFSENAGQFLISQRSTLEVWNPEKWELITRFYQHKTAKYLTPNEYFRGACKPSHFSSWIEDSAISRDGKYIAACGDSTGLSPAHVYEKDGTPFSVLESKINMRAERLEFSNTGSLIAVDYEDFGLSLNDVQTGKHIHLFTDHNIEYTSHSFSQSKQTIKFSNDDSLIAAGFNEGSVWIWNCKTGELVNSLCAVGDDDGKVVFEEFDKVPPRADIEDEDLAEIRSLEWSYDNKILYIGTDSGLYIWNLETHEITHRDLGEIHNISVWNNPENHEEFKMAVYDDDKSCVKILDSAYSEMFVIEELNNKVEVFLAFSNDGTYLQTPVERVLLRTLKVIEGKNLVSYVEGVGWDGSSDTISAVEYEKYEDHSKLSAHDISFDS